MKRYNVKLRSSLIQILALPLRKRLHIGVRFGHKF
jgi:hypothetical protein